MTARLLTKKKPVKVISNDVNWESYAAILRGIVPNLVADNQVNNPKAYLDNLVNNLSTVMYNTAKHCQSQRQVNVLNDQPKASDESCYHSLLKSCLGVHKNISNEIVLIESGFIPLIAVVYGRQLNFYRNFKNKFKAQSTRCILFNKLLESKPSYLQHYVDLNKKYNNKNEIHFEYLCKLKEKIRQAADESHYKFSMYLDII